MTRLIRRRYEPRAVVGAGAQGEVLCARDLIHDRLVALKVCHLRSPADRDELLAEARTLLNLRPHPGVPLIREDFFSGDRYHIVMDWVAGVDLFRLISQAGPAGIPYQRLLAYLTQVADALDHLHRHNPPIVHKDVKPANIVIDGTGRAVLVDFGISTGTGRHEGRSGTTGYVAPEVAAGERARPPSDIFSLAATAYVALTGALPEPGAKRRWRGVPEPLAPRVEAAFSRGLALDPARRPPTARAFVELLGPQSGPHNLPAALTRFVGRQQELADLAEVMHGTRLLALVGSGGVGKTRLATELAADIAWTFPDGVWLVELASVGAEFVTAAVAKVLGVREEPGRTLLEAVAARIRDRQVLVILDNCEHVLDDAAGVAEALLKSVPGLSILATSRQSLDVFGEVVHRVPTLSFPEATGSHEAEEIASYEAVDLFCERAHAADRLFALDRGTAPAVAQVCAVLDGIPLALEMAASRLRELSLSELTASLGAALELRGARTAPSRQRTLAATVAWSYDLLSAPAAALFRRLGIFAGTFSLEAAQAVCGGDGVKPSEVEWLLQSLAQRSLVVRHSRADPDGERYRMLETLRLFARELATEAGEQEGLVNRHFDWFLATAEEAQARLFGPEEPDILSRLERDNDNLRLALSSASATGRSEESVRLAVAMSRFWNVRGYWREGRRWLDGAIAALPDGPDFLRARALAATALMCERRGDFAAAVTFGEEALRMARRSGDGTTAAEALASLSNTAQYQGEPDVADALLRECIDEWRASGAVRGVASSFAGALGGFGWTAVWRGNLEDARRLFEEALSVATHLGIARARSYALLGLASVAEAQGELVDARRLLTEASAISEQLEDRRFLGLESFMGGIIAFDEHDFHAADLGFREALASATERGEQILVIRAVEGLARLAARQGDPDRAATLFGAAAAQRGTVTWPVAPAEVRSYEAAISAVRHALGHSSFDVAWQRGLAMSGDDAVRFAREPATPADTIDGTLHNTTGRRAKEPTQAAH